MPDLPKNPKFIDHDHRFANEKELHSIIREWVAPFESQALYALLDEYRVPYGPVYSIADIFADPHIAARDNLVQIDDPNVGPVTVPAPYPRLSHAAGRIYNPAPAVGDHNEEIFQDLLGLSDIEIEKLSDIGVI